MSTVPKKGGLEEEIDTLKKKLKKSQEDNEEIKLMVKNEQELKELQNSSVFTSN